MLDAQVRSAALRAAAKVAFSMMAVACGGVIESSEAPDASSGAVPSDPGGTTPGAPNTNGHVSPPRRDTPASTPLPRLTLPAMAQTCDITGPEPVNEANELCCEDVIATEISPDGLIIASELSSDAIACCKVVVPFYDEASTTGTTLSEGHALTWSQRYGCCSALDPMPIGPTCTPWGPPLPPTMRDEVA